MGTARRSYLYVVCLVSLAIAAVGVYNLLAVVLGSVADALGASIIGGSASATREQISLAIALVVVGLPVWVIHWTLAERGIRGTDARADADRRSSGRAFYLSLVGAVSVVFVAVAAIDLGARLLGLVLDVGRGPGMADQLAILVTATPIWVFHASVRTTDRRRVLQVGPAAWLPRLYRYGAAFGLLAVTLFAAATAIGVFLEVLVDRQEFGVDQAWWREPLASSTAAIAVGLAGWWVHWRDGRAVIEEATAWTEDERATRLRATYFGAVTLLTASFVAMQVAGALAELGRWALGSTDATDAIGFLEGVAGPPLAVVPFVVAGWLHVRYRTAEAAGVDPVVAASAARVTRYLLSAVGLTLLTVGVGQLIGVIAERLLVGAALVSDSLFRDQQVPWYAALSVVGLAIWLPAWTWILRRRAAAPEAERRSAAGRGYLFLVVGAALLASVPSAAFVLYRLIDSLLGGRTIGLAGDLAVPIAAILVGAVVAGYHGRILLGDIRTTAEATAGAAGVTEAAGVSAMAATAAASTPMPAAGAVTHELVLRGPVEAELDAIEEELRHRLPRGVSLERRSPPVEPRPV